MSLAVAPVWQGMTEARHQVSSVVLNDANNGHDAAGNDIQTPACTLCALFA